MARCRALAIEFGRLAHGHSEFVLVQTGRDVGMGAGIDVRVDPNRETAPSYGDGWRAQPSMCNSLALSTLKSRMPERRARSISSGNFPTPEKTTLRRGLATGLQNALEFAARHDVEAGCPNLASSRRIDRFEFAFTE